MQAPNAKEAERWVKEIEKFVHNADGDDADAPAEGEGEDEGEGDAK
jgi:hypothetical protein